MIALPGCLPTPSPGGGADATLTVNATCDLGTIPEVMPGDRVRFCNNNECKVTILFEKRELFGRNSVRIEPGNCVNLRVRKGAAGHAYELDLDCDSCDGLGGGNTSPEMKVGGGGGP